VCPPEDAVSIIQSKIDLVSKDEMLKKDKIDGILLDIRQTILSFKESKSQLLTKTETNFKILSNIVKDRMGEIIEEIDQYYDGEMKTIRELIVEW